MQRIIRWAGSKRQLVDRLEKLWQKDSRRYIEPFCGSACLFFHLEPANAVLGDLNSQLITTYRALKHDASLVLQEGST
jgi:DNA adenine methylase